MMSENKKRICPTCFRMLDEDFVYCPICGEATGSGDRAAEAGAVAREAEEFLNLGKFEEAARLFALLLDGAPVNLTYLVGLIRAYSKCYTDREAYAEKLNGAILRLERVLPEEGAELIPPECLEFTGAHAEYLLRKAERAEKLRAEAEDAKRLEADEMSSLEVEEAKAEIIAEPAPAEAEEKKAEKSKTVGDFLDWLDATFSRDGDFEIDENGTLLRYCGLQPMVNIPTGVKAIGERAFKINVIARAIIVPEGVISIGERAFVDCRSLEAISLPKSLCKIGKAAFAGCTGLTEIDLSDGITYIGEDAFFRCPIKSVIIPKGPTEIPRGAFRRCEALTDAVVSESVKKISGFAFNGCQRLERITLPTGLTEIGAYSFSGCSSLNRIFIPDGVKVIKSYAFSNCHALRELRLPESLELIEECAFADTGLKTAVVGSGTKISRGAFPADCLVTRTVSDKKGGFFGRFFKK